MDDAADLDERSGAEATPEADDASPEPPAASGVTLNQVVGLLLAIVGLRIGLDSLHDNSFFTHLATGRWILDHHSIPRSDIYSFTAHGHPWTVQSWGASVIYALTQRVAGDLGIRILVAACTTAMAVLVWRLTSRAEGLVGRLAIAVPALAVGASLWVERPLIFSLLFLMAVLFVLDERLDPRWLLPIMWLWVNVHGSFPLGIGAIVAFGIGRLLDRERPAVELRALGWATLGTVLGGVVSPVGPRLLVFPVQLLQRREAFSQIVEWQPPHWDDWGQWFFAFQLALAVVLILWRSRRWHQIVPVALFAAMSLQSSRNIVHASLVFIPPMAIAAKGLGRIDGSRPLPVLRPVRWALVALAVLVAWVGLVATPNYDLQDYPVKASTWMRANGLLDRDDRVVTRDFVGNYWELRFGPDKVRTYIDDRVDMYPIPDIADYTTLLDPDGDYAKVLDRAGATAVLWDRDTEPPGPDGKRARSFGRWLEDPANGWKIVHRDDTWLVAVPAGSDAAAGG